MSEEWNLHQCEGVRSDYRQETTAIKMRDPHSMKNCDRPKET